MSRRNFLASSLAAVFPGGSLKAQMKAAAGAAVTGAAATAIVAKVPYISSSQHLPPRAKRCLLTAGLGLVAGRIAWDRDREVALGIAGGMGAALGAEAMDWLLRQKFMGGTGYLGATDEIEQMGALHGVDASTLIEAQETVGDIRGLDASVSVEDDSNLAWIG